MTMHPYIKYGIALVMEENSLHNQSDIHIGHIVDEIRKGLRTFRVTPNGSFEGKDSVSYIYTGEEGSAKNYRFLAPHVITTDIQARNLRGSAQRFITDSYDADDSILDRNEKIGMSEVPVVGEFSSFSSKIGRGSPKSSKADQGYGLVTSLTQFKPAISNSCLIPDLDVNDMVCFIQIFKRLLFIATEGLLVGNVKKEVTKSNVKYIPKRPRIERGNFPNAPHNQVLGSIALLGSIGELGKEKEYSEMVSNVLEKLKERAIYIIKYGDAKSYSFSQYVIELAKTAKLNAIVDSINYSVLYNQDRRSWDNTEYQKFDMFASRFLQLFNRSAFKDFLSFRAEYPHPIELLMKLYFNNIEKMDKKIIESVKCLGGWLNRVAYKAAIDDMDKNKESKLDLKQRKSKVLVELESSIFAAKSPDALIAQTITRAGRLSDSDAPVEASLFIEETLCGKIDLNVAKNMLIAFSRIRTSKENTSQELSSIDMQEDKVDEDYSQI